MFAAKAHRMIGAMQALPERASRLEVIARSKHSMREVADGAAVSVPAKGEGKATEAPAPEREGQWSIEALASWPRRIVIGPPPADTYERFPWLSIDTIAILLLTAVAGFLRFWHISHPPEIVFDEVHFVGQARHYLHDETFLDPHPPVAKLVIAAGIALFGDHPASWRYGNATLGTLMIAVTYLLGRRMFRSRLAAFLGAALIALDGDTGNVYPGSVRIVSGVPVTEIASIARLARLAGR
jgi:hypothetical protein